MTVITAMVLRQYNLFLPRRLCKTNFKLSKTIKNMVHALNQVRPFIFTSSGRCQNASLISSGCKWPSRGDNLTFNQNWIQLSCVSIQKNIKVSCISWRKSLLAHLYGQMSFDSALFHAYQVNYQFIVSGGGGGGWGGGVKGACSKVKDQEKLN